MWLATICLTCAHLDNYHCRCANQPDKQEHKRAMLAQPNSYFNYYDLTEPWEGYLGKHTDETSYCAGQMNKTRGNLPGQCQPKNTPQEALAQSLTPRQESPDEQPCKTELDKLRDRPRLRDLPSNPLPPPRPQTKPQPPKPTAEQTRRWHEQNTASTELNLTWQCPNTGCTYTAKSLSPWRQRDKIAFHSARCKHSIASPANKPKPANKTATKPQPQADLKRTPTSTSRPDGWNALADKLQRG